MLDEIVRDGARPMLAAALQAEVAAYIDAPLGEVDEHGSSAGGPQRLPRRAGGGHRGGCGPGAGAAGQRQARRRRDRAAARFTSAILPAWARKSPKVAEVLPLLYLHGLSTGDFGPALEQFLGSAAGLSAATITRLTTQWQDEAEAFNKRSLADTDYVYVWVDGIHFKVRLEQDKVCLLVMIGVRADGTKELVALADGFRESTESWADLLRPAAAAGWPPRCWPSATGRSGSGRRSARCSPPPASNVAGSTQPNVLSALPKSAHPGAKAALAEIYNAEDRDHA